MFRAMVRLSVLLLLCVFVPMLNSSEVIDDFDNVLRKGIFFNEEPKILLVEKFIPVQFLVPFPKYNFTLKPELTKLLKQLNDHWNMPSASCKLDFSTHFASNISSFDINWMLTKLEAEVNQSKSDVELIRQETATFLQTDISNGRSRRASHVGLLAMAGIGLFGSGIAMGSSGGCGLAGVFGTCQDQASTNAANIEHLRTLTSVLTSFVSRMNTENNEKFFIVKNKLEEIEKNQKQMVETQNKNWEVLQRQFEIIDQNFHILRDCNQMLYTNQQLNFNYDTAASLLSLLYADVKAYRSALYTYRMNVLNSIPTLLQQHLPMSLVPKESLLAIVNSVGDELHRAGERLSLAIPTNTDPLSYYDAKLVRDVITVEEGLILTLAIPLASRTTAFSVYRAHVIPMPQPDPRMAIRWVIEAPYLAISELKEDTITMSQEQYDRCIGSSTYKICHQTMASYRNNPSCLATLRLGTSLRATETCDTEVFYLPTQVQATNLGFGIWLLLSANDNYDITELSLEPQHKEETRIFKGCKICLITVKCHFQLNVGVNVKIRPDLEACSKINATFIDVQLPDPLRQILGTVPDVNELPFFDSKTTAGVELIKKVRAELIRSPEINSDDDLVKIAEPISMDMSSLNPSFKSHFNEYVPAKLSLSLTVIVFIGSMLLHILMMYLYHKCKVIRNFVPAIFKHGVEIKKAKPVIIIPPDLTSEEFLKVKGKHEDQFIFVTIDDNGRLIESFAYYQPDSQKSGHSNVSKSCENVAINHDNQSALKASSRTSLHSVRSNRSSSSFVDAQQPYHNAQTNQTVEAPHYFNSDHMPTASYTNQSQRPTAPPPSVPIQAVIQQQNPQCSVTNC